MWTLFLPERPNARSSVFIMAKRNCENIGVAFWITTHIFAVLITHGMSTMTVYAEESISAACTSGFFLLQEANVTTCHACAVCPLGFETASPCSAYANTTCNACADGYFSPGNGSSCKRCTRCPPGTFMQRACSRGLDTVCTPCEAGTFSSGGRHRECSPCRQCPGGKYEKRKCSTSRNTKCKGCGRGRFSPYGKSCAKCTTCTPGTGQRKPCNKSSDAECETCPEGMFSLGGKDQCRACSVCGDTQQGIAECTPARDTVCFPCPSGFFFNNQSMQCTKCSSCRPGSIVHETCSVTSDTVCSRCPSGTYSSRDGTTCLNCTTCGAGWRVSSACKKAKDTVCRRCPDRTYSPGNDKDCVQCSSCPAGTETRRRCTSKRDTSCRRCQKGFYSPGHGFSCRMCSLCAPGMYAHRECSRHRDTDCRPCQKGSYTTTWSSRRECRPCTTCSRPYAIMRSCQIDSDVECGLCSRGQFRDQNTQRCVSCSYCYPDNPGVALREEGCWQEPEQWQCRPLAYTSNVSLTDLLSLETVSRPDKQTTNQTETFPRPAGRPDETMVLFDKDYSSDEHLTEKSLNDKAAENDMARLTVIIIPACVGIILVSMMIAGILIIRNPSSGFLRMQASSALSRQLPPPYSEVMGPNSVMKTSLWLTDRSNEMTSEAAARGASSNRHSWPRVIASSSNAEDVDHMSVVSHNVLSRASVQERLEERMSGDCRLYPKPHSLRSDCDYDSDSLPCSAVV